MNAQPEPVFGGLICFFYIFALVITVVIWCSLCTRLGYPPLAGLLAIIPLVNLIAMLYWAFAESPNEQKIRQLEQQLRESGPGGPWDRYDEPREGRHREGGGSTDVYPEGG